MKEFINMPYNMSEFILLPPSPPPLSPSQTILSSTLLPSSHIYVTKRYSHDETSYYYNNIVENTLNNTVQHQQLDQQHEQQDTTANINDWMRNSSDIYTPYADRPETYIVPVVFALIFVVGVLGNGTLVVIFLRHRAMRNIPNTYILSLALADLLVILICVPMASILYTFESWPWGDTLCRVTETAKDISIGVSVFTLTALSAERYCAIVNPLRKLQTSPMTVITAVLIWLLAIICATPSAVVSDVIPEILDNVTNRTIYYCSPFGTDGPYKKTYTQYTVITKAIIYYFLPLSIIGVLYALMARRLHLSAREMPGELVGPQSRAQARARLHVARMVVTFVIVFIACFLPHHVFELWFHLNPHALEDFDAFWNIFRIIGFCFSFLNSCLNPVALYCVSGVFRQHFHHYLCCQPMQQTHRTGLSSAAGIGDTSFMSTVRRNYNNNNNNNNNNSSTGGGSSVVLGGNTVTVKSENPGGIISQHQQHQLIMNSFCKNIITESVGTASGKTNVVTMKTNISPKQSIIIVDKR